MKPTQLTANSLGPNRLTRRTLLHGLTAAAGASLLAACAPVASPGAPVASKASPEVAKAPSSASGTPTKVVYVNFSDPAFEPAFYAIQEGKVKSKDVDLQFRPLALPAIIEALNTRNNAYDILEVPSISPPRLAVAGVPINIIGPASTAVGPMEAWGILVKKDSPIQSFSDLKGRKLAVEALGATNALQTRLMLRKQYGLQAAITGGDISVVEAPSTNMPALMQNNSVDAMYLVLAPLYTLLADPQWRSLGSPQKAYADSYGLPPILGLRIGFSEVLKAKASGVQAALELLQESHRYYAEHTDEVDSAVSAKHNIKREFLSWVRGNLQLGGQVEKQKLVADLTSFYQAALDLGELKSVPSVDDLIWKA